jgi:hypothetical protein
MSDSLPLARVMIVAPRIVQFRRDPSPRFAGSG